MASEEEHAVKQAVLGFLKTADMEKTTERTVLTHLGKSMQLSRDVKEYKPLISSTIDEFLANLDEEEEGDDGGDDADYVEGQEDDEDHEDEDEAPAKGGRKRAGGKAMGAAGAAAAKKPRGGGAKGGKGGGEELLYSLDLSGKRKARVRRYEGKMYVDVREFYQNNGEDAPTQKGLSMDPGQWGRLVRELPRLVAAQRSGDTAAPATQLSKTRIAAVNEFKGTCYLGLREYYEKDGQLAPTKKGVNLNPTEAEALLGAAAAITAAAGGIPDDLPPLDDALPLATAAPPARAAAAAPAAAGPSSAPSGRTSGAAASAPASASHAAGVGAYGGGAEAGGGEVREVVELGSNKRMSISRFGGRISVDLREFYEKNGEKLPGKKGISLSAADWATLAAHLGDVSGALARKDMGYVLQLSGMRRVSLSEFKGQLYVGVREFYEKGGQMLPGAKGLSMNAAQWAALCEGAQDMSTALARVQG